MHFQRESICDSVHQCLPYALTKEHHRAGNEGRKHSQQDDFRFICVEINVKNLATNGRSDRGS